MPSTARHFALICITGLLTLTANLNHGQQQPVPTRSINVPQQPASNASVEATNRFDLDFFGGSPRELVAAMERASGESINVIITDDKSEAMIPAIKLRGVTVAEVFNAATLGSERNAMQVSGTTLDGRGQQRYSYQNLKIGYSFIPSSDYLHSSTRPAKPVWTFRYDRVLPPPEPPIVRAAKFYQLGTYLDSLTVDDITTAIQTAWRMLDNQKPAELSFHKETQILIAVGEERQLAVIDSVLQVLPRKEVQSTNAFGAPKFQDTRPVPPRIELPPDSGKKASSPANVPAKP